jgi:hypothetical protein
MKFKNVHKLFALIIYYKLLKVPSYGTWCYYNYPFCKEKHLQRVAAKGVKSSPGPVLHSYIWMPYTCSSGFSVSEEHFLFSSMSVCLSRFLTGTGNLHDRNKFIAQQWEER